MVQLLSAGLRGRGHNIRWTKAHPERRQPDTRRFTSEQRSIYAADLLAGGDMEGFLKFTGLRREDVTHTTDVAILTECSRLAPLMLSDSRGLPVTVAVRDHDKLRMLERYKDGRTRDQFRDGTPMFAAAIRQPAKTVKLTYNGQRSRAQWTRIVWDKHFTGAARERYGAQPGAGVCKCCQGGELETQAHIILRCDGGSMATLRSAAIRTMSAVVVKLAREHHPYTQLLLQIQDLVLGDEGAQLWTGMISPSMLVNLDSITQFVPPGDETAHLNALVHNMCRPLATGVSDMYTERSRLLAKVDAGTPDTSAPTVPTNFPLLIRTAAAAQKRRAQAKRRSRLVTATLPPSPPKEEDTGPSPSPGGQQRHTGTEGEDTDVSSHIDTPSSGLASVTSCPSHIPVLPSALATTIHDADALTSPTNHNTTVPPLLDDDTVTHLHDDTCIPVRSVGDGDTLRAHSAGQSTKTKAARANTKLALAAAAKRMSDARLALRLSGMRTLDTYFKSPDDGDDDRTGVG